MGRLHPALPVSEPRTLGLAAELDVVRRLGADLPDAFSVFHSVDWSSGSAADERHGEIDVVVVNQAGDLMLIEVKAGGVEFRPDGIFKHYGQQQRRNVGAQVRQQYAALRSRLQQAGLPEVRVHHLLVLPDVRVQSGTVQWPRERIVDSDALDHLPGVVLEQLGPGMPARTVHDRVIAFLEDRFHVIPDVSALTGRVIEASRRLSAGLATWVPRLTVPSGLIRVVGTAGSGKTQLALRLLRDADRQGLRAGYLCFNRALADHMARIAPVRTPAETFHEYAVRVCRQAGMTIDFTSPGVFDRVAAGCAEALERAEPDLDLLVLDEGQDLQPQWVEAVLSRLRHDGRAVLMEDPDQQLYPDRPGYELPEATTVASLENFRTPRAVVRLINLLRLTGQPVEACSPHEGDVPDPIEHEDDGGCPRATRSAIERCLQRGFALDDIAVISLRGRERSALLNADRLGPWTLRRFSGAWDESSTPIWTEGELLVESVRRFKGQAAPAVVLTECDFESLDPMTRKLLFVGFTRASMHVEWVISRRFGGRVAGELGAG